MNTIVLASILFVTISVVGQTTNQSATALNSTENTPLSHIKTFHAEALSQPHTHSADDDRTSSSVYRPTLSAEPSMSPSNNEPDWVSGTHFVAPTFVMEPNNNKWHTLDRKFILFSVFSTAATIADVETTARGIESNPNATELDPLFGKHPTRARLYGISIPTNSFLIYWSYHFKKIAPRRNAWEGVLKVPIVVHTLAAVNNVVMQR
jgi:hypothetical protein